VTEARGQERGIPTVVNTWGEMNASRSVLAASIDDRLRNPVKSFILFMFMLSYED
jgi:ribosome biogenesis protein NSA1